MRIHIWSVVALLPLLLGVSQAAQNWSSDQTSQPWIFSSEDNEGGSYLGLNIADVSTERLTALKLKEEKGVEVTLVDQDAPAGKAGIKEHDVILTLNGGPVESKAQLQRMIHETPPGRVVTLGLSRDGQPLTIKVQLADKHKEYAFAFSNSYAKPDVHVQIPEIHMPEIDMPAMNMVVVTQSARSGLMVENITPQLGEFFGVKNGNGVLIRSVDKGSRAEKAGFRAGDIIVKVNDQPVHDTSDFAHAVKSRSGNAVNVGLIRDKKEQNLNLTLPERKDTGSLWEEESFDMEPLMQADTELALSETRNKIAQLRPHLELAAQDSRKAVDTWRKEFAKEQEEFSKQAEKQKGQFQKDMEQLRLQLKKMSSDWL
jgi:serine protease Do